MTDGLASALFQLLLVIVGYLTACATAWGLHELAHYAVHSIHAESVTIGFNRWGPYTDVIYEPTAPTYAIRLGSIAPTLLYGLVSLPVILIYLQSFPLPRLGLTEWSLVLAPAPPWAGGDRPPDREHIRSTRHLPQSERRFNSRTHTGWEVSNILRKILN